MDIEHKRRVFAIVRDAVGHPAESRDAFIADSCANDERTIADVHRLLGQSTGDVLDRSAGDVAARLVVDADDDVLPAGADLGGWRIERALGSGGMGTVYLAVRSGDGYAQHGALKLIKRGMDSQELIARFRRERQILSRLAHPNIARLLDGGIAPDGRPFLVMEYVDGESLQAWAAHPDHGLDARIELFLAICAAVAHAHRQLIVHRDIKPGNVLVDAGGQPRLLDFGIAKVIEESDRTERTQTAQRFFSRAYAAPEQMNSGVVTTATDVYQLGVLLFELLSGSRHTQATARESAPPSLELALARGKAGVQGPASIGARQLRGDAGILVARATDPEPARRYATVEALADDVRRWRDGRPIRARADSAAYRLRRFAGRHRLAVALGALATLALLGGTVLALWQAQRAEREAQLARSAQAFLVGVFDASAPDSTAGARVTARDLLDRGAQRIATDLADQPRLRGEMLLTLGVLYRQLGQYAQAASLLDEARAIHADAAQAADRDAAVRGTLELAAVERERENLERAEALLQSLARVVLDDDRQSRLLIERAMLRERQQRFEPALDDARAAARLDLQRGAPGRIDHARARQIEALILTRLGRFDEAAGALDEAIATASGALGAGHTRVAEMHNDYAVMLASRSLPAAGEAQARIALAIREQRLGDSHPAVAETLQVLGGLLRQQGKLEEAGEVLERSLRIQRLAYGGAHGDTANTLNSLAILALTRAQYGDAERHLREALQTMRELGQGETPSATTMQTNLGVALMRQGRYDESEPLLLDALQRHRGTLGDRHPAIANDENTLAQLATRRGDAARGEAHARNAVAVGNAAFSPGRETAAFSLTLATALMRARKHEEALETARAAQRMLAAVGSAGDPRVVHAVTIEADALIALGRAGEAAVLVDQVSAARRDADAAGRILAHALRARLARAQGRTGDARRERADARVLLAALRDADPELAREIARD